MKKIVLFLIMLVMVSSTAWATATKETSDTQARPISLYGKTDADVITSLLLNDDGEVIVDGDSLGIAQPFEGTFNNGDLDGSFDLTISTSPLTTTGSFDIALWQGNTQIDARSTNAPDNIYQVDTDLDGAKDSISFDFSGAITDTWSYIITASATGTTSSKWVAEGNDISNGNTGSVNVYGSLNVGDDVVVDGDLTVNGAATFTGDGNFNFDNGTIFGDRINDKVGIRNSNPNASFSEASTLVIGDNSGSEGVTILSGSASKGSLFFADDTSGSGEYTSAIYYDHAIDTLYIWTDGGSFGYEDMILHNGNSPIVTGKHRSSM